MTRLSGVLLLLCFICAELVRRDQQSVQTALEEEDLPGYTYSHAGFWDGHVLLGTLKDFKACGNFCIATTGCEGFSMPLGTGARSCFGYGTGTAWTSMFGEARKTTWVQNPGHQGHPTNDAAYKRKVLPGDRKEYEILLPGGGSLGVVADWSGRRFILIKSNKADGMIPEWNANHKNLQVKPGDKIIEVNGIKNDVKGMLKQIKKKGSLAMRLETKQEESRVDVEASGQCPYHEKSGEDCGHDGISKNECEEKGCCWDETSPQNWCYPKGPTLMASGPQDTQVDQRAHDVQIPMPTTDEETPITIDREVVVPTTPDDEPDGLLPGQNESSLQSGVVNLMQCRRMSYTSKEDCECYSKLRRGVPYPCKWQAEAQRCKGSKEKDPAPKLCRQLMPLLHGSSTTQESALFGAARKPLVRYTIEYDDDFRSLVPPHMLLASGSVKEVVVGFSNEYDPIWKTHGDIVAAAENYVLVETYRMEDGQALTSFRKSLEAMNARKESKAAAGESVQALEVFMRHDPFQSSAAPDIPELLGTDTLKYVHLHVEEFDHGGTFSFYPLSTLQSKVMVVDGRVAVVTGANWQDRSNLDMAVVVEGDVVQSLETAFWYSASRGYHPIPQYTGLIRIFQRMAQKSVSASPPTQTVPMLMATRIERNSRSETEETNSPMRLAVAALLAGAQKSIFVQTPNLNVAVGNLLEAANRGVDVTIYLSLGFDRARARRKGQGGANIDVAAEMYKSVKKANKLRICWFVPKGYIAPVSLKYSSSTTKLLAVDDQVAFLGSMSLDKRTFYHSQEVNVAIDSAEQAARLVGSVRQAQNTHAYCNPFHQFWPPNYASLMGVTPLPFHVACEPQRMGADVRRPRIGILQVSESFDPTTIIVDAVTARESFRLDCVWITLPEHLAKPLSDLVHESCVRSSCLTLRVKDPPKNLKSFPNTYPGADWALIRSETLAMESTDDDIDAINEHFQMFGVLRQPLYDTATGFDRHKYFGPIYSDKWMRLSEKIKTPVAVAPMRNIRTDGQSVQAAWSKAVRHAHGVASLRGDPCAEGGPIAVFEVDLLPLTTTALLQAVHAFYKSRFDLPELNCIVLKPLPGSEVSGDMQTAIHETLSRYPFILADFSGTHIGMSPPPLVLIHQLPRGVEQLADLKTQLETARETHPDVKIMLFPQWYERRADVYSFNAADATPFDTLAAEVIEMFAPELSKDELLEQPELHWTDVPLEVFRAGIEENDKVA